KTPGLRAFRPGVTSFIALCAFLAGAPLAFAQPPDTDDHQWHMPAKNYASTRYSTLDEITTTNAKDLQVAWTFSTGLARGHEAAPLIVGDTMYLVTPYPNILYALDLTK